MRLSAANEFSFDSFDEIVPTKYRWSITRNLNGLDFANFRVIIEKSRFKTPVLELAPFKFKTTRAKRRVIELR